MTDFIQDFLSMPLWFIIPLGIIYVASLAYILYILWHYRRNSLNAVLLTVALLVGQQAWAESSWEVKNNNGTSNTFTIKRSEKGYAQTVHFRTVSLSAYAGQHFTAVDMDYTFPADEDEKTVTVSEKTPAADAYAYKYQNGNTIRKYRFEVTDRGGFTLASADRTMITGTSFNADKVSQSITNLVYFNSSGNYTSGVNSSKYVDVSYTPPTSQVETSGTLNGYVLIDDSYDYAQKPATVSTSTLINSTNANATYLNDIGYKIYATVCFTEKEKDDGYQYIQIIAGDGSASYDTGYDPNKSVNDPVNSVYKTCFELSDGSNAEGKQYFPHRYDYANKSAASVTLVGGKTYTSKDLALKKAEVGKVFGADGNIYDNATAATAAGTTGVAMITYVGSENGESAPYNHGLALAMSDANSGNTCQWKTSNTDAGHTKQSGSFTTESGLQYNDATHNSDTYPAFKAAIANNSTALPTGCSAWFLPSGYQWNQMINACKNVLGANNNYTDLRDGFSTRGGSNLQSGLYWSSSEYSDKGAWFINFSAGQGHWYSHNKDNEDYVRSAFAF